MRKTIRAAVIGIPVLLTAALTASSWVYIEEEAYAQESSSQVQTPVSKGSIVIRPAQESDFPGLAKVSLPEAMRIALRQVPGDLLKAETEEEHGTLVHQIEVVAPDKSIVEFSIDAGTGAILKQSVDHLDDDKNDEHEEDDD
jgi:uncharacterized membrane protein YkoI